MAANRHVGFDQTVRSVRQEARGQTALHNTSLHSSPLMLNVNTTCWKLWWAGGGWEEALYRANSKSHATAVCILISHDWSYAGLQVRKNYPDYMQVNHCTANRGLLISGENYMRV